MGDRNEEYIMAENISEMVTALNSAARNDYKHMQIAKKYVCMV